MQYKDIGLNRLFLNKPTSELREFSLEILESLYKLDDKEQRLYRTLLTFMQLNQSHRFTAKHLHIHVNTLYQRLQRIETVLQMSFQDRNDLLQLQLACYINEHWNDGE